MFVNIFASSADFASVISVLFANFEKNSRHFSLLAALIPPIICGISFVSSIALPSAILSGQNARKMSFPGLSDVCSAINSFK